MTHNYEQIFAEYKKMSSDDKEKMFKAYEELMSAQDVRSYLDPQSMFMFGYVTRIRQTKS